jgi:F0F1-type ATP synthase assembly protein I
VYYGEDLFDDEVDDNGANGIENALSHFFVGALETAAWLAGAAVVGALIGTDLRSSPWFWLALIVLPLALGSAIYLRRTRRQERIRFDAGDAS